MIGDRLVETLLGRRMPFLGPARAHLERAD